MKFDQVLSEALAKSVIARAEWVRRNGTDDGFDAAEIHAARNVPVPRYGEPVCVTAIRAHLQLQAMATIKLWGKNR